MTMIEKLEDGINTQNWDLIREIYKDISGKDLEQKKKVGRPKTNKAEQNILKIDDYTPYKPRVNLFVDDGTVAHDNIKYTKPPSPRTRPYAKKVSVTCSLCNKTEKVAPILSTDPEVRAKYKCNKCLTGR